MEIFIKKGQSREGPYSIEHIAREIAANRLRLSDLGARHDSTEWIPLMSLPEVVDAVLPKPPEPEKTGMALPPVISSKSCDNREAAQTPPLRKNDHPASPRTGLQFRTLHLVIVCATALLAVWIIKGSTRTTTFTAPDGSVIAVNVSAIEKLLKGDSELGTPMYQQISAITIEKNEDLDHMAALIRGYVGEARRLDTASCPRDFAEAYYRHVSAWSDVAEAVAQHPALQSGLENLIEGFLRGLGGDLTGGAFEKQDEWKRWGQRIQNGDAVVKKTWEDTEALAIRYGARLPGDRR